MALALQIEPTPLHTDEHGVVRVGPTRVTLDQVVHAFRDGVTPEEIAMRYDTLDLGDVYSTVAYYLHHPESVNEISNDRQRQPRMLVKSLRNQST